MPAIRQCSPQRRTLLWNRCSSSNGHSDCRTDVDSQVWGVDANARSLQSGNSYTKTAVANAGPFTDELGDFYINAGTIANPDLDTVSVLLFDGAIQAVCLCRTRADSLCSTLSNA